MDLIAETLRNVANVLLVIGLALAAAGTFGVNYFRGRHEKEREERQAAKEAQQATHEAEFQSKLEALLDGNQVLQRQLAPFEKLAKDRYPGSSTEDALAKFRVDLSQLEARAKALEEQAAPRVLTDEQRRVFLQVMASQPKAEVFIQCIAGNQESCTFANQLGEVFRAAGFPTEVSEAVLFGASAGPPVGVYMLLAQSGYPSCAPALQAAFAQMGLSVETYPRGEPGRISITVGVKPEHG
jgi:type II secretory pathway pseudopilin PulG